MKAVDKVLLNQMQGRHYLVNNMVIKALFHIIKNVLRGPTLPLPSTVQQEMPQFEEAFTFRGTQIEPRNLVSTSEKAELQTPAGPLIVLLCP